MKKFDLRSFGLGLTSGLIVLFVFAGGKHMLFSKQKVPMQQNGGQMRNVDGGGFPRGSAVQGGFDRSQRMAERFGMSPEELQAELDSGKTIQDIAQEKGIDMQAGRFGGNRGLSATGSVQNGTATGSICNTFRHLGQCNLVSASLSQI